MMSSLAARDVPSPQEKEHGMIEVPPTPITASWQKSKTSLDVNECVQVIHSQEHVWVRDSKNPRGSVLGLTRAGWTAFLVGVQRDEFDRSGVPA
jgi:hypothetical protein